MDRGRLVVSKETDWERVRAAFPVFAQHVYLNTGTFGPLLGASFGRLRLEAEREITEGRSNDAYYERLEAARDQVRKRLAALLKAETDEIAITTSTTGGAHLVMSGLNLTPGDEIITTDLEHHTFITTLRSTPATVRVVKVSHLPAGEETNAIAQALHDQTALIALSQVSWMDGRVLPVRSISALGPPVFVDGAQSVGAIETDVKALGCDFITFPGQKWLLGPDATGGVYIARRWHAKLKVALPSYYGHQPWRGQPVDVPLEGAKRFEPGPIALPMIGAWETALEFSATLWHTGLQRARQLSAHYYTELASRFEMVTAPGQSTLLVFNPGGDAERICAELAAQRIVVRTVPPNNWLRVSVGYWNNEEDLERLLEGLKPA